MNWRRALSLVGVQAHEQTRVDPDETYLDGYRAGYAKGRQAEALDWHAALFEDDDSADWPDASLWAPAQVTRPVAGDLLPGDGQQVTLTGYLVDVLRHANRTGAPWAEAGLLPLGADEVIGVRIFPQLYQRTARLIWDEEKVTVSGRVDYRPDAPVVIAHEVVGAGRGERHAG